jgi:glutaredoxin 3
LSRKGAAFTEVDAVEAMIAHSGGCRTVPQVFIGRRHVGGADDLQALNRSGQLAVLFGDRA